MTSRFDEALFLQLPETTQHLLELMSIIYSPITVSPLSKLPVLARDVKVSRPLLDSLVNSGWLTVGSTDRYACAAEIRDDLTRRSLREGRFAAFADVVGTVLYPESKRHSWQPRKWPSAEAALRDLRLCVLLGRQPYDLFHETWQQYFNHPKFLPHPWYTLWGNPLDEEWLPFISNKIFLQSIAPVYLVLGEHSLQNVSSVWEHCHRQLQNGTVDHSPLWLSSGGTYYWQLFQRGQWNDPLAAEPPADAGPRVEQWCVFACARALSQGKRDEAILLYQTALKQMRKRTGSRKGVFGVVMEIFYVIALLLDGKEKSLTEALTYIRAAERTYPVLMYFAETQRTGKVWPVPDDLDSSTGILLFNPLLAIIVRHWQGQEIPTSWLNDAETRYKQLCAMGYHWLAGEYAAVLAQCLPKHDKRRPSFIALSETLHAQAGTRPLIAQYQPQPEWERSLQALQRVGHAATPPDTAKAKPGVERFIWLLSKSTYQGLSSYAISPLLQKSTKSGWTGGRNVALKRLATEPEAFPCLSLEDRPLCQAIGLYDYGYYRKEYELPIQNAWPHLVGHPRTFWAGAHNTPLNIQTGREELLIMKEQDRLRIKLYPELPINHAYKVDDIHVVEETTVQLRLYKLTPALLQLHQILGNEGLLVPASAEASVRQTLEALAPMITIQSDIEGLDNAEIVQADPRLYIHLLPLAAGLRFLMRVQPFGDSGPIFPPGSGRNNVMTELDRKPLKTLRNLKQERQQAQALLQDCPALAGWEDPGDDWAIDEPEPCLEALQQLHALGERIVLKWPEGEKLRITRQMAASNLSLKVRQSGDWFEMDGSLRVDDHLVLSLRQLLDLSATATGRFVKLGDGQFLTLTRQFQKKLETLRAYAETSKQGLKVGALAGMALEDLIDEVGEAGGLEADKHWKAQVSRLKKIRKSQPLVPPTLLAELRDYQEEGFRWMMRLAEWGVGACLADDMGLGKTIQTLGVLLARADQGGKNGAALVVAPVSVCNNWYSECQRFAPSLRPVFYRGKDRQQLLDGLQAHDLLITSYGLLQQDAEVFQKIHWNSIVLDEAQAIKNSATKRTQAAYLLQGDFRLVTTGTPIENHLGELWSLFRFLNPGLLFSQQKFAERFQAPIERGDGDEGEKARHHLKKLVQPFMLRRTKNQVLQELPPRTEITLTVALSDEERALYEALRQQALERFAQQNEGVENKHLEVLAEITRLRLAACHPQLAMPGSALPSSKLQAFGELVIELRENQHKALVFSQFVKHLTLIRAWLDEQGIPYQYLDGSTTLEQRAERVEAFQRGEGDIFLISLKAGGFGINLTAADYVIHMDPWWNPAVEDQASDRAHRIGQHRPVTVYRLVSEGTIEEKIVKLHQQKRDLADSLLEGSDMSGKLSAKDMLEMIRTGA